MIEGTMSGCLVPGTSLLSASFLRRMVVLSGLALDSLVVRRALLSCLLVPALVQSCWWCCLLRLLLSLHQNGLVLLLLDEVGSALILLEEAGSALLLFEEVCLALLPPAVVLLEKVGLALLLLEVGS